VFGRAKRFRGAPDVPTWQFVKGAFTPVLAKQSKFVLLTARPSSSQHFDWLGESGEGETRKQRWARTVVQCYLRVRAAKRVITSQVGSNPRRRYKSITSEFVGSAPMITSFIPSFSNSVSTRFISRLAMPRPRHSGPTTIVSNSAVRSPTTQVSLHIDEVGCTRTSA
jgi:hypothetical protein